MLRHMPQQLLIVCVCEYEGERPIGGRERGEVRGYTATGKSESESRTGDETSQRVCGGDEEGRLHSTRRLQALRATCPTCKGRIEEATQKPATATGGDSRL